VGVSLDPGLAKGFSDEYSSTTKFWVERHWTAKPIAAMAR
jgi:hypothetical protein